jgi:quercetin dioxygenase-like cupin family protein
MPVSFTAYAIFSKPKSTNMKRNRFIAAMLTVAAAPIASFGNIRKTFQRKNKAFKISAGEGRIHGHIKLKGVNANILDLKVSGSDTDDGIAIFEQTSLSQGRGTPLHVHPNQDEIFYVMEGSYRFKAGDDLFELAAGDSIFLPRNVPHAWLQLAEKGKMLVILQPAGKLENFFVTMAALDKEPSNEEIAKIFAANEMQVLGPPLKIN